MSSFSTKLAQKWVIMNPHCNPQQLNVSAKMENTVVEDGYLGLKPRCEENEYHVLQGFPMKDRKLLNRNLQHKLSQLNNWREQSKIEIFHLMSNVSPSLFYAKRMLPCHGPHPLGFLSSNNIPLMKTALSHLVTHSLHAALFDLVKLVLVFLHFPLFTLGDDK